MPRDILLQPAYLLHSRPYRDSSALLDFLTRDFGRVSAVARGVRRPNSSTRGLLQPFTPLQASFSGRGDLKTLCQVELLGDPLLLRGERLFSALYINELVVRLTYGHETEPFLFEAYEQTLTQLKAQAADLEPLLRCFELGLLEALGYGIPFDHEVESGEPIEAAGFYHYQPEGGFSRVAGVSHDPNYFSGAALLRMSERDFAAPETRKAAKRLLRQVLNLYLGDKPLLSRQLFGRQVPE